MHASTSDSHMSFILVKPSGNMLRIYLHILQNELNAEIDISFQLSKQNALKSTITNRSTLYESNETKF